MRFIVITFLFCVGVVLVSAQNRVCSSREGFQFEVSLIPQKNYIVLGEPIYMDFEVRNLSKTPFVFLNGGDYRNSIGRPESFEVTVVGSDGLRVPQPKIDGFSGGGLTGFVTVLPMKSKTIRLYLPHWATFERAGEYSIEVKRNLVVRSVATANEYFSETGILVSAMGKIKVESADSDKMAIVVETIGRALVERDNGAERLAPYINDPRFITYLASAIKTNAALMRALAAFTNETALEAILSRKADPDSEVRRNVSVALFLCINPRAKPYLLSMRTDANVGIRLDVVQYLGKVNSEESTRILREMANDPNQEWIGSEAKRYLKERGEKID